MPLILDFIPFGISKLKKLHIDKGFPQADTQVSKAGPGAPAFLLSLCSFPCRCPLNARSFTIGTMDAAEKAALLSRKLQELGSVLVAYSGGTDSAFLAWAAHRALGDRMLAVIADSASLPRAELEAALAFAREQGIPAQVVRTGELDKPEYARNDAQRCFFCKDELFTVMEAERARLGFEHLAYGMNLDDRSEFRPGQRAAAMHKARAPLAEA